ncbi:MAG TPA: TRAP transporter substrate-binding protein DctP [Planctomycetota bacterium]|nr:TRAP transporter substrate-binding protein DctP [Planctomycetota bacterium]
MGAVALLTLAPLACDERAGPRRIRLSLILGDTSEWYQGALKWKELVEARTKRRYAVEVVPNATRSGRSQTSELQMVQQGKLEASLESTILLSTVDPRWTVFCFPWLFPDHTTANAVCDGPLGDEMLELLRDHNLVGLAYGANGFHQITNSVRPIRAPDDLKGLRIRIAQGLPPGLFEAFGASTSTHQMDLGDLYLALERGGAAGGADGQESPLSAIHAARLHTVQKHITLCNFVYDPIVLCVNRDLWYSLPGADQKTLRDCAREAMQFERQLVADADQALPAKLQAQGMVVTRLKEIEQDTLKARAQAAVRDSFANAVGKELLGRFQAAVKDATDDARAKAAEPANPAP